MLPTRLSILTGFHRASVVQNLLGTHFFQKTNSQQTTVLRGFSKIFGGGLLVFVFVRSRSLFSSRSLYIDTAVHVQVALDTSYWTIINHIVIWGSLVMYFVAEWVYNYLIGNNYAGSLTMVNIHARGQCDSS